MNPTLKTLKCVQDQTPKKYDICCVCTYIIYNLHIRAEYILPLLVCINYFLKEPQYRENFRDKRPQKILDPKIYKVSEILL